MEDKKGFASNFTTNRRVTPRLIAFFENKEYTPKIGNALDIGFGIGQDSKYLAERGYMVDAIDKDPIAIIKAKEFNSDKNINFIEEDIKTFVCNKKYDLVVSFLSLFGLSKDYAKEIFAKIIENMNNRGYWLIRLLGPEDEWKNKITTRSKLELEEEFSKNNQMKILSIQESFEDKYTANKTMKHRHFVDVILQKSL